MYNKRGHQSKLNFLKFVIRPPHAVSIQQEEEEEVAAREGGGGGILTR